METRYSQRFQYAGNTNSPYTKNSRKGFLMSQAFIEIDPDLCNKDGLCAAECPTKVLGFPKDGEIPVPMKNPGDLCILCGHCVAICPTAAIRLSSLSPEDCMPIERKLLPNQEEVMRFLSSRRSIRNYKKDEVPREKIEALLSMASVAPTGHNSRCVEWLVIQGHEKVQEIAAHIAGWMRYLLKEFPEMAKERHMDMTVAGFEIGIDPICRSAPNLIVACADNTTAPTASIDCATAIAYLELAAPSLGLGTCWAGYFHLAALSWPPLEKALDLPKGLQQFGGVFVGVPKYRYQRIPPRSVNPIHWK